MNEQRKNERRKNKQERTKKNDTQQRITLRPSSLWINHDAAGEREKEADLVGLVSQCVYTAQLCGQDHNVLRVASICSYFTPNFEKFM